MIHDSLKFHDFLALTKSDADLKKTVFTFETQTKSFFAPTNSARNIWNREVRSKLSEISILPIEKLQFSFHNNTQPYSNCNFSCKRSFSLMEKFDNYFTVWLIFCKQTYFNVQTKVSGSSWFGDRGDCREIENCQIMNRDDVICIVSKNMKKNETLVIWISNYLRDWWVFGAQVQQLAAEWVSWQSIYWIWANGLHSGNLMSFLYCFPEGHCTSRDVLDGFQPVNDHL